MDDSLLGWLAVREPADVAARSAALTRAVAQAIDDVDPVDVLDLATGTGSNVRYLADYLPYHQRWLVVDRDSTLLAEVPARMSAWGVARGYRSQPDAGGVLIRGGTLTCRVDTRQLDLGAFEDPGVFTGRHLVTASALLDLVSERWLRQLAALCHAAGAAVLFGLTYNGQASCLPAEPEDEMVRLLMNTHQKRDKGLGGPAAGPDAAECAARCFADLGYTVRRERSDWVLGPGERECQQELIEGWAEAAIEISPDQAASIASWRSRRLAHVDADRSRIVVGHHDIGGWLTRRRKPFTFTGREDTLDQSPLRVPGS